MAEKFLPLPQLRKLIDGARADLKQVRDINAKLSQKVTAVKSRPELRADFAAAEIVKLRASAREVATGYLRGEGTGEGLASVRAQPDYWTLPMYLARAAVGDVGTGDALMRQMLMVMTLPKLPTDALAAMLEPAIARGDWPVVAQVYYEGQSRVRQGDQAAIAITASLSERSIPEIAEAKQIIAQARQLEEFTGYSTRSITTGQEDLGVKMEGYAQQAAEKDSARAA